MIYRPIRLLGSTIERGVDSARIKHEDTTYFIEYEIKRHQYVIEARREVVVDGEKKIMRIRDAIAVETVDESEHGYDRDTNALLCAIQKLEPLVAYRLRELNGEDHLAADPVLDNEIEIQRLAAEAVERESVEAIEGWGSWG